MHPEASCAEKHMASQLHGLGFQMPIKIKRPTSIGLARDQEAAVQRTFIL